jgi:acetyl-CoA carboxylase biotin carboxyl carrier protein
LLRQATGIGPHEQEGRGVAKVAANMAGTIWKILVKPGEKVEVGQEVVILESMKMEIPVPSAAAGVVRSVLVKEGDFVNDGTELVELE